MTYADQLDDPGVRYFIDYLCNAEWGGYHEQDCGDHYASVTLQPGPPLESESDFFATDLWMDFFKAAPETVRALLLRLDGLRALVIALGGTTAQVEVFERLVKDGMSTDLAAQSAIALEPSDA